MPPKKESKEEEVTTTNAKEIIKETIKRKDLEDISQKIEEWEQDDTRKNKVKKKEK